MEGVPILSSAGSAPRASGGAVVIVEVIDVVTVTVTPTASGRSVVGRAPVGARELGRTRDPAVALRKVLVSSGTRWNRARCKLEVVRERSSCRRSL